MVDMKDFHVIDMPMIDEKEHEHYNPEIDNPVNSAIDRHPLKEISQIPGHLLLLKLWQREEDLLSRRISLKEIQMDTARRQIFQLSSFFFLFHGFFLTILFCGSVQSIPNGCRQWWIPSVASLTTSIVIAFLVQVGVLRYWKVWGQLQRERGESRALARGILELRMKGASFDLSKEWFGSRKRMKSSSVEIKWKPLTWCFRNLITIVLVCFAGLIFPISKLILC